ncbi:MAG: electron transport complex subunit RsxG [Pseudomonadales bacterium]
MLNSLRTNALGIAIFATLTAAVIALTYVTTKPVIAHNIKEQQAAKLYQIVPKTSIDNDLLASAFNVQDNALGREHPVTAYRAMKGDRVSTVIFPVVTPHGYSGDISLLVGINADASVAGVRVITHKETPGLGDKLELKKSPWIKQFDGQHKTSKDDWAVKKDGGQFDQFTGATITPRAVVNAVGETIDYFRANREALLTPPQHEVQNGN